MKTFKEFMNEEKWSKEVDVKKHPKEKLFSNGSAKELADWAIKSHKDLRSSMAALSFYVNRGGSNVSKEVKDKVEEAKKLVHKHYGVSESEVLDEASVASITNLLKDLEEFHLGMSDVIANGSATDNEIEADELIERTIVTVSSFIDQFHTKR
jgi:hypothetical protein